MKLFSLLAGTAFANKGDDRVFANSIHFIQGSMSSWREVSGENQLKVIQRGTDDFFDTFFVGNDKKTVRVRNNLKKLLANTKNNMDSARARCSPWNVDRKRRSTEVSERWTMPDDVQTAWHQLFVLYARYVREETYPKCPKRALKFVSFQDTLPLRCKKAGIFEKLLAFARSHSIVTRGSVSLSFASTSHSPCFSKS